MAFKYLNSFLFLIIFIYHAHAAPLDKDGRRCVEGKTYNDGCNNCFCVNNNESGAVIACTYMFCPDVDQVPPPEDFWEH